MAKLIYSAIASLDGFTEDAHGKFDWAAPDLEVHAFVNERERQIGTYLYGRRMYETMMFWETSLEAPDQSPVARDYAEIWQSADKVVYSRTLESPSSARTHIEAEFDPAQVRAIKEAADRDVTIGGAELAAQALRAGLVDEVHLYLNPVVVGAGRSALPSDLFLALELLDERRFANGTVYLRYRVGRS